MPAFNNTPVTPCTHPSGSTCPSRDSHPINAFAGDHPLTAEAIARKVGIITLPTTRDVAAEDGVDEDEVPLSDPRVQAVVRSGSQIRGLTQVSRAKRKECASLIKRWHACTDT